MKRVVTEMHTFSPQDLIAMAMAHAKMDIVGSLYRGEIKKQDHEWSPDGNLLKIITVHIPEED